MSMNAVMWAVIACGLLSIVYGVITGQQIMKADAGSKRMQEIAGYVQEGAAAYLNRQYTTIGFVGAIMFVLIGVLLGTLIGVLPGVGPVTAQQILDYRTANGAFRSVDELDAVPGIGPARLEQLRPLVDL